MKLVLDIRHILDLLDLVSFIRTRYKISLMSDIDRNPVALIYVQRYRTLQTFYILSAAQTQEDNEQKKNDSDAKLTKVTRFYDR